QRGVSKIKASSVYRVQGTWKLSHLKAVATAWNNQWFSDQGLKTISHQQLDHWKPLNAWIRLA
ncbi:group II intron reverse transcriptase/maturase, partial [Deltaproteobacteria bacterium TL4]